MLCIHICFYPVVAKLIPRRYVCLLLPRPRRNPPDLTRSIQPTMLTQRLLLDGENEEVVLSQNRTLEGPPLRYRISTGPTPDQYRSKTVEEPCQNRGGLGCPGHSGAGGICRAQGEVI